MTIKIIQAKKAEYPLSTKDFRDGHAYESMSGAIYIGNRISDSRQSTICGFSVNGSLIAWDYDEGDEVS